MKRALGVVALLLGVVAMSVGSAGLAVAQGNGPKSNKAGAPPGNNGTIKIDQTVLVSTGKVDHANHPHVSCQFALSFFGFDTGLRTAHVQFSAQPPSGKFQAVVALVSPTDFTFTGHGPGGSLDISLPYQLDVTGLKANPNQGFHIKVDVEVNGSIGSDDKYKVFWYKPCGVTPPPSTTTTTIKEHETTTTTEEHETTTTTEEHQTTTTTEEHQTTTTTEEHHGTTTTSTTLTPTSSTAPEHGTTTSSTVATTVPPTTAPPTTTPPTTSPPTTAKETGPQTGTTTTTTVAHAAPGQSGQSPSGLAFTSGPTPSGAGTDLGFFSAHEWIGSSSSPWLMLIAGGILLAGAGAFALNGNRIKKWVTRA